MDRIKTARRILAMVRELIADADGLTFEEIQEKASKVNKYLINKYNLIDSDGELGARDDITEEESYELGYIEYTLWDNTWEKQANDLLNIELYFRKTGVIEVYAHTFGDGIEIHKGTNCLTENQVYDVVDKILKDWRKEFPAIYKK